MSINKQCKHEKSIRERASELFEQGYSYISAANLLYIPRYTVRQWEQTYRSVGREGLLNMGTTYKKYTFETKVAAAKAVVEGKMSKPEAMEHFGIVNLSQLKNWCKCYCEGGAEALRPRPKGRPKGSCKNARPKTREEVLEREVQRLEAEVAYLKKSIALKAELRSQIERKR